MTASNIKVYRNKYDGVCAVTGSTVPAMKGWTAKAALLGIPSNGKPWVVITDGVAAQRGYVRIGSSSTTIAEGGDGSSVLGGAERKGRTLGLSVRDTLAHLFEKNEQAGQHKSDAALSAWLKAEFPGRSEDAYSPHRVRMYRNSYNRSAHSFAGRSVPDPQSREYAEDGSVVEGRRQRTVTAGLSEEQVTAIARREAQAAAEAVRTKEPVVVSITVGGSKAVKVEAAGKHAKFVDVLKRVEAGVPVLLVGPAGSGKTTLAAQVAEALGRDFSFNSMSEGVSESSLLGRSLPNKDGEWKYQLSPFARAYKEGGVHLLDEVDAADPNLLVSVNAAIANRMLSLPLAGGAPIKMHEDFVLLAAANTFGNGADRQYVGRNQLDAATMDRFRLGTVLMDYDRDVEKSAVAAILGKDSAKRGAALLQFAWGLRDLVAANRMRRVVSTRGIVDAAKLMRVGISMKDVADAWLADWTADEKARVNWTAINAGGVL